MSISFGLADAVGIAAVACRSRSLAKQATKERPNGSSFCGLFWQAETRQLQAESPLDRPKKILKIWVQSFIKVAFFIE